MTPEQEKAVERVRSHLASIDGEGQKVAALYYLWMAGTKTYQDDEGRTITEPTGENSDRLVQFAAEDPAAWDAACMLSAGLLENSEPLPEALGAFTARVLRGSEKPKYRGGSKYANLARDLHIAASVEMLLKAGLVLSRNDATRDKTTLGDKPEQQTASSIIAAVLNIDESSIPKIWRRYSEHVAMTKSHGPYYFTEHGLKIEFFRPATVGK